MNNLSLVLLGLVLIYMPTCFGKQCFSESLEPPYPCCSKGKKVRYTDKNGKWGVENGNWCGIDSDSMGTCFSVALGYPCCSAGKKVRYTDKDGSWGVENGNWCGIDNDSMGTCFSVALGYPCCSEGKEVRYTDEDGSWGVENGNWCGIEKSNDNNDNNDNTDNNNDDQQVQPVQQDDSDFDFKFLKLENNKKNMLYSPLSIKYALQMLQEGAANNTFTEINKLAGNDELTKYTSIDKNLSFANGLIIRDMYYDNILKEYIKKIEEDFGAEIIKDEFKDAKNTNQWIEDKTLGIIKNMLKDDIFKNPNTVMLIINALAIDMEWNSQFKCANTHGRPFYLDSGDEMKATTMTRDKVFGDDVSYYMDDDLTVLTMDLKEYAGTQFEFMTIMPKENLSEYVENVTKEQIDEIDKKLILASDSENGINISIPKFKFSYDLKLKDDLQSLGIKDAFDDSVSDFSKMSNIHLYVSDALHKADIEFTEEGVKAAAVTVIIMMTKGALIIPENPVNVVIDKPFMFIIRDKATKDVWFTGTVYKPNAWEDDQAEYEKSFDF